MNRSGLNSPLAKIVSIVIFVGLIALWIFWPRHVAPPDEKYRLWHPEDGYSIIVPAGWVTSSELEETTAVHTNRGWIRGDDWAQHFHPPSLVLTCLRDPLDFENSGIWHFTPGTFHGMSAMIADQEVHKDWVYRIIFKDRDRWFDLWLTIPHYEDVPHSSWWPYIDSFRYEPERAKKLATTTAAASSLQFTTQLPATSPAQ